MRIVVLALALLLIATTACGRRSATREDCREILDRLVALEIAEKGFRDPALAARWTTEAERAHTADLTACEGKRMPRDAMTCVRAAKSSEEIVHQCMR